MVIVVKRDGSEVDFDRTKITKAVDKALIEVEGDLSRHYLAENAAKSVESYIDNYELGAITVEDIQDLVENCLMDGPSPDLAKAYIRYRYKREMARNQYTDLMDTVSEKLTASNVQNQNANVDEHSFGGRMGEMASAVSRHATLENLLSPMARNNHLNNEVYIHDLDAYAVGSHNCLTIPFDKLLANGFNTRQADIRPANSVGTAFQLVAVIFQLQSLQQFGGVSASHLDWTMVPYMRKSFYKHYKDGMKYICNVENWNLDNMLADSNSYKDITEIPIDNYGFYLNTADDNGDFDKVYNYALDMTEKELKQAVEAMYHNLSVWAA